MISEGTIAARGNTSGTFASMKRVAVFTDKPADFAIEVNQASNPGEWFTIASAPDGLAHEGVCPQGDWRITNNSNETLSYSLEEVV